MSYKLKNDEQLAKWAAYLKYVLAFRKIISGKEPEVTKSVFTETLLMEAI